MTEAGAHFDFLGYRFQRGRDGGVLRLVRPKSKQSWRSKLKKPTKRCNRRCLRAIISGINPVLEGWFGYFQARQAQRAVLDGWLGEDAAAFDSA